MLQLGVIPAGLTVPIPFTSYSSAGASASITGLAVTDIEIYKGTSMTQRASDNGYALMDTDGIDIDSITGLNGFSIDLSDNSDAGFYAVGSFYAVVVSTITVDGQTVTFIAATFRIGPAELTAGYPVVTLKSGTGSGEISLSSGTVSLAATPPTAAAIATAVWQDATGGDFTTANSIGKALYINNVAPGAAGGHMISGANAGTTTFGALTVTGAVLFSSTLTITGNVVFTSSTWTIGGTAITPTGAIDANVTKWGGADIASPATAGYPVVTLKVGTGTGEINTSSGGVPVSGYASGQAPLQPTVAGRTLDVTTTGEAGIDWGNVGSPTSTVGLSGTTVKTATDVEADTQDIQSRLPAALTGGGNIKADALKINGATPGTEQTGDVYAALIPDGAIAGTVAASPAPATSGFDVTIGLDIASGVLTRAWVGLTSGAGKAVWRMATSHTRVSATVARFSFAGATADPDGPLPASAVPSASDTVKITGRG